MKCDYETIDSHSLYCARTDIETDVVKDVVDLTSKLSSWGAADPGRMDRESLASWSSWYEECAYVRSKPLCDYYHSGCESRQPYSMGVHPSLLFHEQ